MVGAALRKLLSIALVLCGGAAGQDAQVRLGLFAEGFSRPTAIAHAGDGSGRVFVVEQAGRIRAVGGDGSVSTFLDIAGRVR